MTEGAPTLRDVALDVLKSQGVSGRDLDRKTRAKGLRVAYTTINAMAAGTYTSTPKVATVEALARLSDSYTREQVFAAARQPLPRTPLAERLPEGSDALLPEQEAVVLSVIRQFAAANGRFERLRQESSRGNASSTTQAPDSGAPEPPAGPTPIRPGRAKGPSRAELERLQQLQDEADAADLSVIDYAADRGQSTADDLGGDVFRASLVGWQIGQDAL